MDGINTVYLPPAPYFSGPPRDLPVLGDEGKTLTFLEVYEEWQVGVVCPFLLSFFFVYLIYACVMQVNTMTILSDDDEKS